MFLFKHNMKKIIFISVSIIPFLISCNKSASLDSFSWLTGKWIGKYDSVPIFEQWKPAEGKVMVGRGGVLSGKDTAFAEQIQIEERADGLYYVASVPGNPAPASFKFTGFKNDTAVFEDPAHDFPQRVLYLKNEDGTFYACIDGIFKGKYVKEEFNYKKAQDW
jgi:hypothetical protein